MSRVLESEQPAKQRNTIPSSTSITAISLAPHSSCNRSFVSLFTSTRATPRMVNPLFVTIAMAAHSCKFHEAPTSNIPPASARLDETNLILEAAELISV